MLKKKGVVCSPLKKELDDIVLGDESQKLEDNMNELIVQQDQEGKKTFWEKLEEKRKEQ